MSKYDNIKVHVKNEAESEAVQKKLFTEGYRWNSGGVKVSSTFHSYLYTYTDKTICGDQGNFFKTTEKTEMTVKEILKGKVPKLVPVDRHIVIEDNCNNSHGISSSYNNAIEVAKGISRDTTIYKMIEVAKVSSVKQVKKVSVPRKK